MDVTAVAIHNDQKNSMIFAKLFLQSISLLLSSEVTVTLVKSLGVLVVLYAVVFSSRFRLVFGFLRKSGLVLTKDLLNFLSITLFHKRSPLLALLISLSLWIKIYIFFYNVRNIFVLNKVALSGEDDKRIVMKDRIRTMAYGHCKARSLRNLVGSASEQ